MSIKAAGLTVRRMIPDGNGGYTEYDDLPEDKQQEHRRRFNEALSLALSTMYSRDPDLFQEHIRRGLIIDTGGETQKERN